MNPTLLRLRPLFFSKPLPSLLLVSAALSAVLFVVLPSPADSQEAPAAQAVALTVETASATLKEWPVTLKVAGPIAAWQEAIIGPQVNGLRLEEVKVNVGDRVKKGQVLARFNRDTLLAEQAELQALWRQAESDYQRAANLKGSGALSPQQTENYANQAAVAKARLDAKTLQLRHTTVIAPTAGTISARTATLGGIGNSNSELFKLIVNDRLEWRGELNAQQLAQVQASQPVVLTLPDDSMAQAKVRQLSPSLDPETRLATVYADVEPGSRARAGMYASGSITLDSHAALIVPAVSVVIRDGRSYVFTVTPGADIAQVKQQSVATGRRQDTDIEILSGRTPDAAIVTQGAGFLNDGDTVRIVGKTSLPTPSTSPTAVTE